MFIARQRNIICAIGNTQDEVELIMQQSFASDYTIEETNIEYVNYNGTYLTADEAREKEAIRIAHLNLTGADVERGLYQALNMDFEDVIAKIEKLQPTGLDIKALKIELKANNFYRGNPYIDAVGKVLGLTKEQLDEFFETNDYHALMKLEEVNNEDTANTAN